MKLKVCLLILISVITLSCRKHKKVVVISDVGPTEQVRPDAPSEEIKKDTIEIVDSLSLIAEWNNCGLPVITNKASSQVLYRKGYILSYNKDTRLANWVAWHLTSEHTTGKFTRRGIPYMVDEEVKSTRQELQDWDDSYGYDHGHMCPAGDNKWSRLAMEQTFFLTNMCPQNSRLNQETWERLESKCRDWANKYGDIYIITGPIVKPNAKTMGENKVAIPSAFYKVVLCLHEKKLWVLYMLIKTQKIWRRWKIMLFPLTTSRNK